MVNLTIKMNLASPCAFDSHRCLAGLTLGKLLFTFHAHLTSIWKMWILSCPYSVNGCPMLYGVKILNVWDNHCPYIINYFLSFWTCSWEYVGLNIIDTQGYVTFLSSTCRICVLCNWNRSEITSYVREDGKRKTKRIWLSYIVVFILMKEIPKCLHAPITVSKLLLQMCCVYQLKPLMNWQYFWPLRSLQQHH